MKMHLYIFLPSLIEIKAICKKKKTNKQKKKTTKKQTKKKQRIISYSLFCFMILNGHTFNLRYTEMRLSEFSLFFSATCFRKRKGALGRVIMNSNPLQKHIPVTTRALQTFYSVKMFLTLQNVHVFYTPLYARKYSIYMAFNQ